MRYVPFLLMFLLVGCEDETAPSGSVSRTDTFLQRMATDAARSDMKTGADSTIGCDDILYWLLLTSDLSHKNKKYDTVVNIKRHTYNIVHTTGADDSILVWINYKLYDTSTLATIAWILVDMNKGLMFDVTVPEKKVIPVTFDTGQLLAIKCSCAGVANKMKTENIQLRRKDDEKMFRDKRQTDAPDYGRIF